ncbi:MAG: CCA tRNA nucleotidyltransferase [bacterium]|nr:CCA tRNA nucleotidyltransferase [bacterium]
MDIPQEIGDVGDKLAEAGFKAYLVGGCVRDILLGKDPSDWDIATDAEPEEIQKLFKESVYENEFGTVGVKSGSEEPSLKIVEVTTFRKEGRYTDKRHPDEIVFASSIEDDLARRDFTINAIAIDLEGKEDPIDPFGGQVDLKKRIVRAVGNPNERFEEDALRLMRAVRFCAQLGFELEKETEAAVTKGVSSIKAIAAERVRDELSKLLMSEGAGEGVRKMQKLGLLGEIVPELAEGAGVEQNKHHIFDVFEHNVRSLEYTVEKGFPLDVRLASLLHDVGKVGTRQWQDDSRGEKTQSGKKGDWTFYQHQYLGEKQAKDILNRLKYPRELVKRVALLVREHMFVYDPEVVTEKGVRRLLRRVGEESIDDLIKVREADRIGSGVPKAQPYRLRYLQAMIEKAKGEPVSVKQLKVNGDMFIKELGMEPGPHMGQILAILLEEVLDDPRKNTREGLIDRVKELREFSSKELDKLSQKAREAAREEQRRIDEAIKGKYFVK